MVCWAGYYPWLCHFASLILFSSLLTIWASDTAWNSTVTVQHKISKLQLMEFIQKNFLKFQKERTNLWEILKLSSNKQWFVYTGKSIYIIQITNIGSQPARLIKYLKSSNIAFQIELLEVSLLCSLLVFKPIRILISLGLFSFWFYLVTCSAAVHWYYYGTKMKLLFWDCFLKKK